MSTAAFVFLTLFGSILTLAIAASVTVATRNLRGEEIVPYEPRRPVPWRLIDVLVVVSLWIVLQATFSIGVSKLLDLPPDSAPAENRIAAIVPRLIADSISKILALGLGIGWLRIMSGATWRDLGIDLRRFQQDVGLGVLAFGLMVFPVYAIQTLLTRWFEYKHPLMEMMKSRADFATYFWSGVAAVIVAPLVEEFIFRVVLQGWLEAREEQAAFRAENLAGPPAMRLSPDDAAARSVRPILITSLVFALMHFGQGPSPLPLFVLALGLGYVYRQTHRIVPSIVMHALLNGCSLILFLISGA